MCSAVIYGNELFSCPAGSAARRTAGIAARVSFGSFDLHGRENLAERGTLTLGTLHLILSRDAGEFLKFLSAFFALEFICRHILL
jgi:hypothetical protein